MATSRAARIGIWAIAGALILGTLGGFLAMVLIPKNQAADLERQNTLLAEYQEKSQAQQKELSDKYYDELAKYRDRVGSFDAEEAQKELKTEDLKVGDGEEVKDDGSYSAYYIGWNPTGKEFDSSFEAGDTLKAPLTIQPGGVITGMSEGIAGMKVGGVREMTIPSDKAYGDQKLSEDIPANTPLRFIVMIIPTPDPIPYPQELIDAYQR